MPRPPVAVSAERAEELWRILSVGRQTLEDQSSANKKAQELFFSLLTDEQKAQFFKYQYVTVKGGTTGIDYLITVGYSQNIRGQERQSEDRILRDCNCSQCQSRAMRERYVYCCHMNIPVPYWDHMVAQLLWIKYAEEAFIAKAYVS